MRGVWLFLHYMGFAAWMGAGLATMLAGITAKSFPPAERLAVYRASGAVARALVGPGALLTLVSGFVLSFPYFKTAMVPGWLIAMQGTGLLGALIAIAVATPTAARLERLELDPRGELPESFAALRKRQAIFATMGGVFAIIALLTGTVLR